jgi:signal transduction histidine kinase/putative methionine-R-sulfoxide reductase with GAF domain
VTAEAHEAGKDSLLVEEQASLRRVATLVASGATASELFAAVAQEVARVLSVPTVMLARYDDGGAMTVVAAHNEPVFTTGTRWPLDGPSVSKRVLETGRPARIDDYSGLSGAIATAMRDSSAESSVGTPVAGDGSLWGVLVVGAREGEFLPPDTEERLTGFSELVGLAISNAAARDRLEGLVDEQAALRRIAMLIAAGASTSAIGSAVLTEAAGVIGVSSAWLVRYEPDDEITVVASLDDPTFPPGSRWSLDGESASSQIRATSSPVRIDDYSHLPGTLAGKTRESGIVSVAGAPITLDGSLWGAICVGARSAEALAPGAEARLGDFTELIATDLSNAAARDRLVKLHDEQAALHRVAMLVAEEAPQEKLFAAVSEEVSRLFELPWVELARYDERGATVLGAAGDYPFSIGTSWQLDGPSIMETVLRTGKPARIDDYMALSGTIAEAARESGMHSAIGAPIIVGGAVWGVFVAISTTAAEIPARQQHRLAVFADLIATAIANSEARERAATLVDARDAVRRVAELVAEGASRATVFDAVCAEACQLIGASSVNLSHYTSDGFNETIAGWSVRDIHLPAGTRFPITPDTLAGKITETRGPARIDNWADATSELGRLGQSRGAKSSVGAPVIVEGRIWGALAAWTDRDEPLPSGTEDRLARFTDLVATAISNSEARESEHRLLAEQAALRRVATLVAEGAAPSEVFAAVTDEVANILGPPAVVLERFEPDNHVTVLATAGDISAWEEAGYRPGTRWALDGPSVVAEILRTGRPARIEDYATLAGSMAEYMRAAPGAAVAGVPVTVDGKVWGAMSACTTAPFQQLPPDIDTRLSRFTELVATAVSNANARSELIESRARLVAAGDEARRRIERDLHDGTQQRLIALGLDLQRIRAMLPGDPTEAAQSLAHAEADLQTVLEEIRELSSSVHPPLLSRRGFVPALRALARRSPIPIDIDIELRDRPPPAIETALYYVASEAITNAIKHSQAQTISVSVETDHVGWPFGIGIDGRRTVGKVYATITDDGIGGAESGHGSGLSGLADRVDALGGRFTIESRPGSGTRISVALPLEPPV